MHKNEQKQTKHTRKHMRIHKNKQYHTWSTARGNYRHTRCTQKHPKSTKTQKNTPHDANTWNHMQKRAITCKNTQNRAKKYKNESKQIKTQKHICTIARTNFGHSRYTTRPCLRGGISKATPQDASKTPLDSQKTSPSCLKLPWNTPRILQNWRIWKILEFSLFFIRFFLMFNAFRLPMERKRADPSE